MFLRIFIVIMFQCVSISLQKAVMIMADEQRSGKVRGRARSLQAAEARTDLEITHLLGFSTDGIPRDSEFVPALVEAWNRVATQSADSDFAENAAVLSSEEAASCFGKFASCALVTVLIRLGEVIPVEAEAYRADFQNAVRDGRLWIALANENVDVLAGVLSPSGKGMIPGDSQAPTNSPVAPPTDPSASSSLTISPNATSPTITPSSATDDPSLLGLGLSVGFILIGVTVMAILVICAIMGCAVRRRQAKQRELTLRLERQRRRRKRRKLRRMRRRQSASASGSAPESASGSASVSSEQSRSVYSGNVVYLDALTEELELVDRGTDPPAFRASTPSIVKTAETKDESLLSMAGYLGRPPVHPSDMIVASMTSSGDDGDAHRMAMQSKPQHEDMEMAPPLSPPQKLSMTSVASGESGTEVQHVTNAAQGELQRDDMEMAPPKSSPQNLVVALGNSFEEAETEDAQDVGVTEEVEHPGSKVMVMTRNPPADSAEDAPSDVETAVETAVVYDGVDYSEDTNDNIKIDHTWSEEEILFGPDSGRSWNDCEKSDGSTRMYGGVDYGSDSDLPPQQDYEHMFGASGSQGLIVDEENDDEWQEQNILQLSLRTVSEEEESEQGEDDDDQRGNIGRTP